MADNSSAPGTVWGSRPVRLIIVCGIILLGVVMMATGGLLLNLRDRDLAESERELKNLALVLAEQIDRSFQSIELIEAAVIERMQALGIASAEDYARRMSGYDTHEDLRHRISALPFIDAIVLTDAQGKLINFSRSWPTPSVKIPDQDPSEIFKSDPKLISFVGKPLRSPVTGNWVVSVARKLTGPNGEFLGVVQGAMELQYFEKNFEAIAITPNSSMALFRRDGTLLVRYPRQDAVIGQSFVRSELFANVLSKSDHGAVRGIGVIDGQERLVAAHNFAHYPVALVVTTTVADALANWKRGATAMTAAALIIGFAIGGVVVVGVWLVGKRLREQNVHFDAALNNMTQGLAMFDAEQRLVVCNGAYSRMYGLSAEQVKPGTTLRRIVEYRIAQGIYAGQSPEDYIRERLAPVVAASINIQELSDGRSIVVSRRPMPGGGWVTTHSDITEQRHAERELSRTKSFLNTVIENVPVPLLVKEPHEHRYIFVNQAAEELLGTPREEIIGKIPHEIFPKEKADSIVARDNEVMQSGKELLTEETPLPTLGRGERLVMARRLIIPDGDGMPQYLLSVLEDVTDRKRAEEQIVHLAHHDILTDLANRALFSEKVEEALARLRRFGGSFAVFMLDLDHFKAVNDSLGHPAGDDLLKLVALRLRECTRETDVVARLGGDEFAILQTIDGNQREGAIVLANRILRTVDATYDLGGHAVTIGTSIGITVAPDDGAAPDQLLKNADLALYRAKSAGRNGYHFFEAEMDLEAQARRTLEVDLRNGIARGEFEIHYQRVIDTPTKETCGVEGLVRWRHPQRGILFPDAFVFLAEDTGLIIPLGEWILRKACADAASWPPHIKVAVNLSPIQFRRGDLVDTVARALVDSRLPPERLELEITESVLLQRNDMNIATLHQLRNLGVSVVLDDFGTGYSPLTYLRMFPFNRIKIDKTFVEELSSNQDCAAIVCAIAGLGRSLNIGTTAEGVETDEQFELVRAAGCTHIQGYLFGRPVPASELEFAHPRTNAKVA